MDRKTEDLLQSCVGKYTYDVKLSKEDTDYFIVKTTFNMTMHFAWKMVSAFIVPPCHEVYAVSPSLKWTGTVRDNESIFHCLTCKQGWVFPSSILATRTPLRANLLQIEKAQETCAFWSEIFGDMNTLESAIVASELFEIMSKIVSIVNAPGVLDARGELTSQSLNEEGYGWLT